MTDREETAIELLLSDPEFLSWLDPGESGRDEGDADDEPPRAA
jgi:hypothetical protein